MTEQENTRYTQRLQWRWREYVQHNESDADWGDWGPWEDIPAGDTFSVTCREEFETRLTYADPVPPVTPPTAPVGQHWSGTVRPCDSIDPHAPHAWQSGDDGFLGGGQDHLCPGYRGDGPETRQDWKERTFLEHYGYRGPWPLTPGQEVSAEDVATLYLAAVKRGAPLYRAAVERWLRDEGDPS